jgi:hypothetical protein
MLPVGSDVSQATKTKSPQLASTKPNITLLQHATTPALPVITEDNGFAAQGVGPASTGSGDASSVGTRAAIQHADSWQPAERITAQPPRHVRHSPALPLAPLEVDAVFSSL